MKALLTIIYAYRNRDIARVKLTLETLKKQTNKSFKVIFVDYGSEVPFAKRVEATVNEFDFVAYWYVGHPGLLWNKSKALNFGIKEAQCEFIILADVDVLFTEDFVETAIKLAKPKSFSLFKIGYLSKKVTEEQQNRLNLNTIKTTHIGDTFGIGLFPKSTLDNVGGLDEFFHFYGSEDEDLNYRVLLSGTTPNNSDKLLLYHQWHERYPQVNDHQLTIIPRLKNVQRINQRHFLSNKENQITVLNKNKKEKYYSKTDYKRLENPTKIIKIENIAAHVVHSLNFELPNQKTGIVKLVIQESAYYNSFKYCLKTVLKKQTQPYIPMKKVNDLVLQKIIFNYSSFNYSYEISEDLKTIIFSIDLKYNYES